MPFDLEIPETIEAYLEGLPVTGAIRARVAEALAWIENLPAEYRADPLNRIPGSTLLRLTWSFTEGDQRIHTLSFAINDRWAVNGVLRIVNVRYTVSEPFLPEDG